MFQSTRPRGARRRLLSSSSFGERFNPRAREGRDQYGLMRDARRLVSIHAPARGATHLPVMDIDLLTVSIHAPARGATWDWNTRRDVINSFQSTRPRGARHCF